MKIKLLFLFLIIGGNILAQVYTKDINKIQAELAAHDSAVHIFHDWMRDPFILIGSDGDYYLTVTQHGDSVDGRAINSIGAPLYKSKDLAKWEFVGYPYTIKDAGNYEEFVERRAKKNENPGKWGPDKLKLWAPEIHFINGKWHLLHTSNAGIGNFVSTKGDRLERPYTSWDEKFGRQHDPTIFQDSDGTCWMVSRCAQIQQLNKDLSGFVGKPIPLNPSDRKMGHEGAYIVKFKEKYILFGTAWSTDTMRHGTYNLYYTVADKLTGPYGPRKFAGRFLGHGTPFKDKQGRWWCTAFFNANKPTISREEAKNKDLSQTAYTLNKQGLTLVPIEIKMENGEVIVNAKDPDYKYPGKEEIQEF